MRGLATRTTGLGTETDNGVFFEKYFTSPCINYIINQLYSSHLENTGPAAH